MDGLERARKVALIMAAVQTISDTYGSADAEYQSDLRGIIERALKDNLDRETKAP